MPASAASDARRAEIVVAAMKVFARYGFRKTSMDEVARAADLSRPGLYLHFSSKELLFRAVIDELLAETLGRARRALAREGPLDERLVDAFTAAHWHLVKGSVDPGHATELVESAQALAGDAIGAHEVAVRGAVVDAVRGVAERIVAEDLGELLDQVSGGLKHRVPSVDAYREQLLRLVRVLLSAAESRAPADG